MEQNINASDLATEVKRNRRNRRAKVAAAGVGLLALAGLVVGGSQAGWVDPGTAKVPITVGSVDLKVNGLDNYTVSATPDFGPGDTITDTLVLRNDGASTGRLSLSTSGIGSLDTTGLTFGVQVAGSGPYLASGPVVDASYTLPNIGEIVLDPGETVTVDLTVLFDDTTYAQSLAGQTFDFDLDWTLSQV